MADILAHLTDGLVRLGLRPGQMVMVHASLRSLGPVPGGADAVLDTILFVLGPSGTLVAYADFEPTAAVPAFDVERSPCAFDHGVLPERLRQRPGCLRSVNPGASMLALGARADWVVSPHTLRYGYGDGTPLARLVEAGGWVLLLGAPLDRVTLLHHAESLARLPGKRIVVDGEIEEFDTAEPVVNGMPENLFERIVEAFIDERGLQPVQLGLRDRSWLLPAPALLAFAIAWMEERYG